MQEPKVELSCHQSMLQEWSLKDAKLLAKHDLGVLFHAKVSKRFHIDWIVCV